MHEKDTKSEAKNMKKTDEMKYRIEKEGENFAVVMVDLNKLKHVNDEYGHEAGDNYIKGCCRMVCDVFRYSPVFRIGGDEFVVLLKDYDYENRQVLTDKLKEDFRASYTREDVEPGLRYSAAVGMAERTEDDLTFDSVFKRADKAMYENKTLFKNKYGSDR